MHHDVGNASAESLAQFGAPAIGVQTEALSHPEMWIRIQAIVALSKIKDPRIAPVLLQMLNDPEREVKQASYPMFGGVEGSANSACPAGNCVQSA